jgi:hypothetical protein
VLADVASDIDAMFSDLSYQEHKKICKISLVRIRRRNLRAMVKGEAIVVPRKSSAGIA